MGGLPTRPNIKRLKMIEEIVQKQKTCIKEMQEIVANMQKIVEDMKNENTKTIESK